MIELLSLTYYQQSDSKNTNKENRITTNQTDENVVITVKDENNRQTITIKALKDIVIHEASIRLDVKFNNDSKFFLNGYQSWTDTKEAYLYEYERIARRAKRFFKKNRNNETYNKLILNYSDKEIEEHKHDLVAYINWSYSIFSSKKVINLYSSLYIFSAFVNVRYLSL